MPHTASDDGNNLRPAEVQRRLSVATGGRCWRAGNGRQHGFGAQRWYHRTTR